MSALITLEEHIVTEDVLRGWRATSPAARDLALDHSSNGESGRRLLDAGPDRLAWMDEVGIDVQVLSLSTPGLNDLPRSQAVDLQRRTNDRIAELVSTGGGRFQGFATLATASPDAAAAELERAVRELGLDGAMLFARADGRTLDDPALLPVFETAEALRAPLYIHPQTPPPGVLDAYYGGLGPIDAALATHVTGWHFDTGVQLLRLIAAGTLDRVPALKLIAGHWGEMILFYLDRIDGLAGVLRGERTPSETLRDQLWVTPGGILSARYLRWATEVLGPERIMMAIDYPFARPDAAELNAFLAAAEPANEDAFRSDNWLALRAGIRR